MTVYPLFAEIIIDHPAPRVWAVLADYANDPRWRTGVVSMTVDPPGPVTPGAHTAEELRFAGSTWHNLGEVDAVTPGAQFTWHTTEGADAAGARTVTPRSPLSCLVRLDLSVTPHGVQRPFGRLLARMLQRNLDRDVLALRDLIENLTRSDSVPADVAERTADRPRPARPRP
ncbi:SRPBCC family protein [Nocardia lasii]|uniref:SRPBCC family protein n=1 Tax=Nocardia lasii TaxID=1616107 RepID=A0ABW1JUN2_9NOCA